MEPSLQAWLASTTGLSASLLPALPEFVDVPTVSGPDSSTDSRAWQPALAAASRDGPHADSPALQVRLRGSVSSQYLTALLMAAPLATGGPHTEVIIADELVSQPYVSMTIGLMERFGVKVGSRQLCQNFSTMCLPLSCTLGTCCHDKHTGNMVQARLQLMHPCQSGRLFKQTCLLTFKQPTNVCSECRPP